MSSFRHHARHQDIVTLSFHCVCGSIYVSFFLKSCSNILIKLQCRKLSTVPDIKDDKQWENAFLFSFHDHCRLWPETKRERQRMRMKNSHMVLSFQCFVSASSTSVCECVRFFFRFVFCHLLSVCLCVVFFLMARYSWIFLSFLHSHRSEQGGSSIS